jgi:hypothetical protein
MSHKTLTPSNINKNKKKHPALRFANLNVRTMCPGLNILKINDARKTAVIDMELSRYRHSSPAGDPVS